MTNRSSGGCAMYAGTVVLEVVLTETDGSRDAVWRSCARASCAPHAAITVAKPM
jgi:hypothetical protein